MKITPFTLVLVLGAVACAGDDGSELIPGFDPPAPADDEIQVVAPPVFAIAPGEDITLCSYIEYRTDRELDIINFQGFQSSAGAHHAILYSVAQAQPANTHPCTDDDMLNARYLAGGGADSPPADLPEGVVFRMPANTQLLIQTHWINSSDVAIDGQAAFNLKVTAPSREHQPAQIVTVVNTRFVLPPGEASTSAECEIGEDMNVFTLSGHMHEWGTHTKITYTAATAAPSVIYETNWSAAYQFNAPRNNYAPEQPFRLSVGDRLKIDCDYMNDTGAPLPFPSEMCIAFAYAYPLDHQINCIDGTWPH